MILRTEDMILRTPIGKAISLKALIKCDKTWYIGLHVMWRALRILILTGEVFSVKATLPGAQWVWSYTHVHAQNDIYTISKSFCIISQCCGNYSLQVINTITITWQFSQIPLPLLYYYTGIINSNYNFLKAITITMKIALKLHKLEVHLQKYVYSSVFEVLWNHATS